MRLTSDYHTHTAFSHGKGSVSDNVEAAVKRGLTVVGIADHSVAHFAYGIKEKQLRDYISCIEQVKREYEGRIDVKTGIEANLIGLDGSVDIPKQYGFDIVIMGYHKAVIYKGIKPAWTFFTGKRFGHAADITKAYMLAIQKNHIDIVSHPGYGVPVDYRMLGRACADYGTLFEINNKHEGLTAQDIKEAASEGASFVLSSEAHMPQDVGNVTRALLLSEAAGVVAKVVNLESPERKAF